VEYDLLRHDTRGVFAAELLSYSISNGIVANLFTLALAEVDDPDSGVEKIIKKLVAADTAAS
jgi:hypothetical protein